MKIKSTLLLFSILGAYIASTNAQTNYALNPSFETDAVKDLQVVPNWSEKEGTDASASFLGAPAKGWTPDGSYYLAHFSSTSAFIADTYQTVTVPNGTYTFSARVVGAGTHTSRYMYAKDFGGTELKVETSPISGWTAFSITNIVVTTGQITIGFHTEGPINSWNDFDKVELLATTLPVTLTSFTANTASTGAELKWQTATETNNNRFEIERSSDGINYALIATVQAKGNSSALSNYFYTDNSTVSGVNYYRLSQTDNDGKKTELGIRTLKGLNTNAGIAVYPNPATNQVTIDVPENALYSVQISDLSGRIVQSLSQKASNGKLSVNLSTVASGTYAVKVSDGKSSTSSTLVVAK